jgi:transcriptional regulator with XRE-family HTH domain
MKIAGLRRTFGLTQEEVARAIGTSKPNVCAVERGRAPGISLERFLALLEALGAQAPRASRAGSGTGRRSASLAPTGGFRSPADCLEVA